MFKYLLARAHEARAAELEEEGGLEGGFTLIELMVVLLIIAILLAIAIPTFLGVSGGARDRSAQSNAQNALTDAIAYYQNAQSYDSASAGGTTLCAQNQKATGCTNTADTVTDLGAQEPTFTWLYGVNSSSGTPAGNCTVSNPGRCVSVMPVDSNAANDGQGLIVATMSGTGTCWFVANLQATPAATAITGTGFEQSVTVSAKGSQESPKGTEITKAGTYYAQLQNAGTNCYAGYPEAATSFAWGQSFSTAPNG